MKKNSCGLLLLKFKLLLHSQVAEICSSAGEKVTAICRRVGVCSLKAAYNKQVLPADGGRSCGGWLLEKRAGGIMTEEINASTKPSKLASVITDPRSEGVDLLRFPPLNDK